MTPTGPHPTLTLPSVGDAKADAQWQQFSVTLAARGLWRETTGQYPLGEIDLTAWVVSLEQERATGATGFVAASNAVAAGLAPVDLCRFGVGLVGSLAVPGAAAPLLASVLEPVGERWPRMPLRDAVGWALIGTYGEFARATGTTPAVTVPGLDQDHVFTRLPRLIEPWAARGLAWPGWRCAAAGLAPADPFVDTVGTDGQQVTTLALLRGMPLPAGA